MNIHDKARIKLDKVTFELYDWIYFCGIFLLNFFPYTILSYYEAAFVMLGLAFVFITIANIDAYRTVSYENRIFRIGINLIFAGMVLFWGFLKIIETYNNLYPILIKDIFFVQNIEAIKSLTLSLSIIHLIAGGIITAYHFLKTPKEDVNKNEN